MKRILNAKLRRRTIDTLAFTARRECVAAVARVVRAHREVLAALLEAEVHPLPVALPSTHSTHYLVIRHGLAR
jgi:hypothetical protein